MTFIHPRYSFAFFLFSRYCFSILIILGIILVKPTIILGINYILSFWRRKENEERVKSEPWSDDKKKRHLLNLGKKESDFLRLRRVRLGVEDFLTIQVIGKGAYGEVLFLYDFIQ